MTDYELLSVFLEFVNTLWMIFATFVSIVFAFIVASHLVAKKLTPRVVSLVISLYTLVAIWSIWGIRQNSLSISATVGEINRRLSEGSSTLDWIPVFELSDFMRMAIPNLITLVTFVVYAGSVVFFFYRRQESESRPQD